METPAAPSGFEAHRPRMLGIAYRMLGSHADAQDVVQDAWLRWNSSRPDDLRSAEAWLVTTVTRLSIDRLRAAKTEREHYTGFWLAEPLLTSHADSPERVLELAGDISLAFLAVLERLTPDERAAFLLREVFDSDYADVAEALGKSEAACRQLVSRAKAQVRAGKARRQVGGEEHRRLLERFAEAARQGDMASLKALVAPDAMLIGDGGGVVPSFGKVLKGGPRIAQLFFAATRRYGGRVAMRVVEVNGRPGVLRFIDGVLESVMTFEFDDRGRIDSVHAQRNPAKLVRVLEQLGLSAPASTCRTGSG